MAGSQRSHRIPDTRVGALSPRAAGWVSLLIFVHLFCVAVALFNNLYASMLGQRIVRALAPYTHLLNFDPHFVAGFHLTHGLEFEDDHVIEVELAGVPSQVMRYPDGEEGGTGWRGGFRRQRWRTLARRWAAYTTNGDDEALSELAAAVGRHVFGSTDATRLTLRCRRRPSQPLDHPPGVAVAEEPAPYQTVYAADVIRDSAGTVRVIKQVAVQEASPVVTAPPAGAAMAVPR